VARAAAGRDLNREPASSDHSHPALKFVPQNDRLRDSKYLLTFCRSTQMKPKIILALILIAAGVSSSPLGALAQPAESTLQLVQELHVSAGKAGAYEAITAARNARMADAGVTFSHFVLMREGSPPVYRSITGGLENMAAFDMRNAQMASMAPAPPGSARGIIENIESSIRRTRPDLSYLPDNPRIAIGDVGFIREINIYLPFGSRAEAARIITQVNALMRRHNIRNPFFVSMSVMGNGPALRIVTPARDAADFYAENQRQAATLGAEWRALGRQMGSLATKIEFTNNIPRRDLGYNPN